MSATVKLAPAPQSDRQIIPVIQGLESIELESPVLSKERPSGFKAFVHVAYGYDSLKWQKNWFEGRIPGLNEEFPYGYHHAAAHGATVTYSTDHSENKLEKTLRYFARGLLGFDFFHAWRNRAALFRADVVWTHTESQSLAVLAVFALSRRAARPKLIGQVVWLMDEWKKLSSVRKRFYKRLLKKADILTFLSPLNAEIASRVFPGTRVEFVKFGINTDYPTLPRPVFANRKIRVLSVGNDRHRDWETLVEAASDAADIEVRLLTGTFKLRGEHPNITVLKVTCNEDLFAQFEWADMVVLPLKPNFHASGITVIEEAVILGVPVISTRVGGLTEYFKEGEVIYIEPYDPDQMTQTIRNLAGNLELQQRLIANSKRRLVEGGISSRDYARRHVELFNQLRSR